MYKIYQKMWTLKRVQGDISSIKTSNYSMKFARVHVHNNKLCNASLFFLFLTVDYSFQTFTSEHTMGADELANIGNRLIDVYLLLARHMAMIDYISKPVEKK